MCMGMNSIDMAPIEVVETMKETAEDLLSAGGDIVEDIQRIEKVESEMEANTREEAEETK